MSGRSRGWFLHAALLAVAFVILAWPLALDVGLVFGALGAIVGTLVAEALVASRYRPWVIWVTGLGVALLGWVVSRGLLNSAFVASTISPAGTMRMAETMRWFGLATGACIILRGTALRFRLALAVEGSVAVAAVVATVAAHRDGMIARPLAVSDWFWSQGLDPVVAFLGLGVAASMLVAGLLLHGRSRRRALVQLFLVLLLALWMASRIHGQETGVPPKNAVGGPLKKDKDDKARGQAGGGGTGGDQQNTSKPRQGDYDDLPQGNQNGQNRPSAIVVFHRDVRPTGGVFYFRHAAFSQFNGNRLVQATLPGVDPAARLPYPSERTEVPGVPEVAPGRTEVATDVALLLNHPRMFVLADAIEVAPKANPDPARFRRAYSVVSQVVTEDFGAFIDLPAGAATWDEQTWELYTELPRDDRYHQLAASLQARLRDSYNQNPLALAMIVKQYLEETTVYSFARKYRGDEPTAEFLFSEDRKGYCVHIAHAAVYLMRAMGLPARVSAGYAVEARNLSGGSALLIKQSDQHAWAELYLEGAGWLPIEVVPEQTDVDPPRFEERDLQQLLGEMARKESRTERPTSAGVPWVEWLKALWSGVPWALLAALAFAYVVKIWRLLAPAMSQRPRLAYRAALDRLSAVGLVREHGESREHFAARLDDVAPSLRPLTAGLSGYVLGSIEPPEVRAGAPLARLSVMVGGEIRRAMPAWRWILGMMNPVSWWWSR